jgi:hypothetical protein
MIEHEPVMTDKMQSCDATLVALEDVKASFRESAEAFFSVRRCVSEALKHVPLAAYAGSSPRHGNKAPDDVIREMVEESGAHVHALYAAASRRNAG